MGLFEVGGGDSTSTQYCCLSPPISAFPPPLLIESDARCTRSLLGRGGGANFLSDFTITNMFFVHSLHTAGSGGTALNGGGPSSSALQQVADDDQPKLFERIEASKLQEAVRNTSTVVQLQVYVI